MTIREHRDSVSVVIPCYNALNFIRETLRSVVSQTLKPAEIILVDDGSTDGCATAAKDFDPSIKVIRQENQGDGVARNRGMDAAVGRWVAFLDADDIWEPQKLELQMAAVEAEDDVICCHSGFYLFGQDLPRSPVNHKSSVLKGDYRIETLLLEPLVNTSTAIVRADVPVRFPNRRRHGVDMLFFTELSQYGRFRYVTEMLAGYRMHQHQKTRRDAAWTEHFKNRFGWVDENENKIGAERADNLRMLLRKQIIDWLDGARWSRQWHRYQEIKRYAESLDWPEGRPEVLHERLYPRSFYYIKDVVDKLLDKNRKASNVSGDA